MDNNRYLTIDGIPVEINGEKNLLALIQKVGIKMPTFCYHSELSTYGACRMCMVEDQWGTLHASCSTPPKPGMEIRTNTERLRKYRKVILELLLANHCRDCTTCDNNEKCKLQDIARRFHIEGVRFPNAASKPDVDDSSPCITIDHHKCILCGDCVRTCNEIQNVGVIDFMNRGSRMVVGTAFHKPIGETDCVGCGQCSAVCPTGAIVVKNNISEVWKALSDKDTMVTIQIAPAVRVAIGRELGLQDGQNTMGLIVAALRRMGFDEIYDTSTAADLTVMEESAELLEHVTAGNELPLFSSCCPAWVRYVETRHPELMEHVSSCKSPMQMFAAVIREQFREEPKKHVHIALMPCTAKKREALREEFRAADGTHMVDYVLTTQEFVQMVKESGIQLTSIRPEAIDMPFGTMAGAGDIFGTTGGVTEAVLRRISDNKRGDGIMYQPLRGLEGVKEVNIPYGDTTLHIGVVSGLGNAEKLIQRIKGGEHFDFVEVMACPGGCINGAGQPFVHKAEKQARSNGLYDADRMCSIKSSEENPLIESLYNGILKGREHELLHVEYNK